MPELPEVEATVRYLAERVVGERITDVQVLWGRTVAGQAQHNFQRSLAGSSIEEVFRRGKFICIRLSGCERGYLLVHLRMSGSLDVISSANPVATHDRVVLHLGNGRSIRFNDTRKFGRMYLVTALQEVTARLGVEPLSEDFTPEHLRSLLAAARGRVKPLLLDQSVIAGLGNIYVDESLWKARIHPLAEARQISKRRLMALHQAIRETLAEAIELLGTDFGDGVVHGGSYQPRVYGREGYPCERCGAAIQRIVVGQRGTHLCARCQSA
jgi:formamidopyrimidine-DNA glycosylase